MLETVRLSWRRGSGTPPRVVAAVSGGADSVALLLALKSLAGEEGFFLSAAHVDHGLRPDSGKDAAFVQALCDDLGVPCRVFQLRLKSSDENAAREARYAALLSGYPEEKGFFLALAHHQRDQAETLLLHLLRGSGGAGLAGMRERAFRQSPGGKGAVILWRPLLNVPPETIRHALALRGAAWREDETNARDDYLRNFLRHQVLPVIRQRVPEAEGALGRAARILAEENDCFLRQAKDFLNRDQNACLYDPCRYVRLASLMELHPALRRHALRLASPVPLSFEQTEALCAIHPGETVNLPSGWRAQCTQDRLHFLPPAGMAFSAAPQMEHTLHISPFAGEIGDGKRRQAMPRAVYEKCVLRTWERGDRIHPLGAGGSKSMQDYFVDKKVPRPFRPCIPLLCDGKRVIWAVGVGPAEEARVNDGCEAVLLRYEGFLPGDTPIKTDTEGE